MTSHRQEPEWQQDVDRHSHLVDPVITVRQLSRFEFTGRRLPGRIDHALVFATARGEYVTSLPPHRPGRIRRPGPAYTALYEVDLGVHPHRCAWGLPSLGNVFEFAAVADLAWQVVDPARVVASGLRDVPREITPRLEQRARDISRRFPIDESGDAEHAVRKELFDGEPLARAEGLRITGSVRLWADERARDHEERLRELRYRDAEAVPAHRHQLLLAQQRQEVLGEKASFYRSYLEGGDIAQLALRLAEHPEDLRDALAAFHTGRQQDVERQLELIRLMVEKNSLERYQWEEANSQATRFIADVFERGRYSEGAPTAKEVPAPTDAPSLPESPA
ncbi:hypothetical protein [Streptomyces sp. PT12]|uniref:hypothetical protein n=1 Tax=Streptomyces sp. PT12 TaxID=1510197 RepID=UPI000DE4D43E|nr:hypothetical protein [Streptomyces sp. PT12]RBM06912.1 hypothetical protein DEH69_26000 [Streptomyces sp. PT12]